MIEMPGVPKDKIKLSAYQDKLEIISRKMMLKPVETTQTTKQSMVKNQIVKEIGGNDYVFNDDYAAV